MLKCGLVVEIWLAEDLLLICVKIHQNHETTNFDASGNNEQGNKKNTTYFVPWHFTAAGSLVGLVSWSMVEAVNLNKIISADTKDTKTYLPYAMLGLSQTRK